MTDPQQKDPLAALEELLQDQKGSGAGDQQQAAEQKEKEAEEKKRQEIAAMEAEQKEEDAQAIKSHIEGLKEIDNTPQEQARIAQIEEKQQARQQRADEKDEYEIRQLGHTKI